MTANESLTYLESVTGGRFHPNFNRIGGVKPNAGAGSTTRKIIQDLPKTFLGETRAAMDKVLESADEIEDLVAGNEIILARTKGIGIIPPDVAAAYGLSGPNLRASGVSFDLRKVSDYLPYSTSSHSMSRLGTHGDCWDRWYVRLARDQAVGPDHPAGDRRDSLAGRSRPRCPRSSRCPRERLMSGPRTPRARWATTWFPTAAGPYRLKIRSASFSNISILPWLLEGALIPDIIAIMGASTSSWETSTDDGESVSACRARVWRAGVCQPEARSG